MKDHYGPNISEYKLPDIDVCHERRNFPGYKEQEVYTIEDMKACSQYGTTDTDSETDTAKDEGLASIYKKKSKVPDWSGQKLGLSSMKNPHTKLYSND